MAFAESGEEVGVKTIRVDGSSILWPVIMKDERILYG